MKTRIIVGVVCVPAIIIIAFFLPPIALGLLVGALSAVAAWEFFNCALPDAEKRIPIVVAVLAAVIPIGESLGVHVLTNATFFFIIAYLFGELMFSFKNDVPKNYDIIAVGAIAGYVIPTLLTNIVKLAVIGKAALALPFLVAFASDSGAYFVGVYLGKHKLIPQISPKKTIEGSIGGFLITIAVMLIYGFVLSFLKFEVRYAVLAVYGFLGSLACQFGDLCFSSIKRIGGIKDFGNIIPGHGGILDRFDGMMFVAALLQVLYLWVPPFIG